MFLTNCWYAVDWSETLGSQPLERMICGEKLVLFRRADGSIAALAGICPHRFASLARGKVLAHTIREGSDFGGHGREYRDVAV
jgi:phenylpropionate dioxygenase-like ring-hydroxylating dioxygenase large terminal subunit